MTPIEAMLALPEDGRPEAVGPEIAAALAGVPCVPVAYDAKVRAAAIQLGIGDLAVALEDVTADRLLARVTDAMEPERQARVSRSLDAMRGQRSHVAARVSAALGRRSASAQRRKL